MPFNSSKLTVDSACMWDESYKVNSEMVQSSIQPRVTLVGDLIVDEVRHNGGVLIHCPVNSDTTYSCIIL